MLLHVIARGKIGRTPEAELVERYAKRIAWPLKLTELPESGGRIPEAQTPVRTVLLDEKGRHLASEGLAKQLEGWRDGGIREARFVIGAATWPHLLARAMLLEQLFRATSILAGHPYHRAG